MASGCGATEEPDEKPAKPEKPVKNKEAKTEEKAKTEVTTTTVFINLATLRHMACSDDWISREVAEGSWTLAEWAQRVEQRSYGVKDGTARLSYVDGGSQGYSGSLRELPAGLSAEKENSVRLGMLGLPPASFPKEIQGAMDMKKTIAMLEEE